MSRKAPPQGTLWARSCSYFLLCLLLLLSLLSGISPLEPYTCPVECTCYDRWLAADCNARGLAKIPSVYNGTTHFYLGHNNIDAIPLGALQRTQRLEVLNLNHNLLVSVDSVSMIGLYSLQELFISQNHLAAFKVLSTVHLDRLHSLDLSLNHLAYIPVNLSIFAPHLQMLNVSHNWLTSAWFDPSYRSMVSLHTLDLDYNPLGTVLTHDLDAICKLPLQTLGLSFCNVSYIEEGSLGGFEMLSVLRLAGTSVAPGNLKAELNRLNGSQTITHIDLSHSSITNVTAQDLCSFPNLRVLNLAHSRVMQWDPKLAACLENVQELNVESNLLMDLPGLLQLTSLRTLRLGSNLLFNVTLNNLQKLESVDLSQNHFFTIPENWLTGCDALQKLNLSHNEITEISSDAFQGLNLQEIDLSHNSLLSLLNFGTAKPVAYYLSHNQISFISEEAFKQLYPSVQTLDLSHNQLSYFPNYTYHSFVALQLLNLSSNHLGHFLAANHYHSLYHGLKHLQILDLSRNNISVVPQTLVRCLPHLTSLYLRGNRLNNLSFLALTDPSSISKLDVAENLLSTVEVSTLLSLQYLEIVDFGSNPLSCTCNILNFIQWLNSTIATVVDLRNPYRYACMAPKTLAGRYILDLRPSMLRCAHEQHDINWDLTVFAIVAGCTALLSLLVAAMFHYGKFCHHIKSLHYKWQIRYRTVADVEFVPDPKV